MALEMRGQCERCEVALTHDRAAFICSYECIFCPVCVLKIWTTPVPIAVVGWYRARGGA